jgi:hypothetical protein
MEKELEERLRSGFISPYVGGMFLVPYHLQLGSWELLSTLLPDKIGGIPPQKLGLQVIHHSLYGIKGTRELDELRESSCGLLSGLPFICSPVSESRFLNQIPTDHSEEFLLEMGKRQKQLGYLKGNIVNTDGYSIRSFSRMHMPKSYLSKEKIYDKSIRTFWTQDQETKNPIFLKASYSGTTVSMAIPDLMDKTLEILGNPFLSAMDKEHFGGALLSQLDERGIRVLLPMRNSTKRLKEMESIDASQFRRRFEGRRLADVFTYLKDYPDPLRFLVLKVREGGETKYVGFITNEVNATARALLKIYRKRWRIENLFSECDFLGFNLLVSTNLNAITANLALKLMAFNLMSAFRNDLGGEFLAMTPDLIHRHFLRNVQGKVKLHGDYIRVHVFGFEHQDAVRPLLDNLQAKLFKNGIDPRIPWLNNHRICFKFM